MLPETMRQGIYLGRGEVEVREAPMPELGPRDVLVRNVRSSICGTDVAVYLNGPATGHKVTPGGEFGHETVSRVAAVGPEVTDFAVGERVYPYPLFARGDTTRAGTLGAFSDYLLCPDATRDRSLYAVDERTPDEVACLIEPFTVGGRAAKQAAPRPGEKAVVFGCGTIGIAAAVMLAWLGVEKVMLCDRSKLRLRLASELGFETCDVAEEDFLARAAGYFGTGPSLTGPQPAVDVWVDAAGAPSILDTFMEAGTIGSRLVLVAVDKRPRTLDLLGLTYASKAIVGSGGYRPEDVGDVQRIMASGRWDLGRIVTHAFPLERLDEALRTAADPERALNVQLAME